jgi:hypothetical protein
MKMGWSESYYRDYKAQSRMAWEQRARQLLDDMELFLLQVREDAVLLGLEEAEYHDLVKRLQALIEHDFLS